MTRRISVFVAVGAALALAIVGFVRGTYAAGGSDSSCYALMAEAFSSGHLQPSSKLASQVPWPDASKTFAPGGFVPSPSNASAASPVCAPGFSLLLAPVVRIAGPNAIFGVTPLAGAFLVWLTFVAGRALAGPLAGTMAAVLVAASPAVLFQVVQPMNDVTTAALWMAVFVGLISQRSTLAGVCCGLALLVRPNLLPLAVVAAVFAVTAQLNLRPTENTVGRDFSRAIVFCLATLPFVLIVLWLNAALYGGLLRSGYGQARALFSFSYVPTNAVRYTRWLFETETPFPLIGFAAPFVVDRAARPAAWLGIGLVAATTAVYLAYTPFDDWSYLRFLLPAITVLLLLASAVVVTLALKAGARTAAVAAIAVATALAFYCVRAASDRFAFTMQALEQRYRSAALVARDQLPANAVLLTVWDSGAIRFHSGKEAMVWEGLDPVWLDRGLDWLEKNGHPPFILLESWEEPKFRARFSGRSPIGDLDWPPKYEVDRVVRIYDPSDRAKYQRGERVITEYMWPLRK